MIVPQKSLFLVGPGFIGGSLLVRLKEVRPDLKLSALTRRPEQAQELRDLGIEPITGSLDDADIISEQASQSDIIIHAATADHLGSALAIVKGIKSRSDKSKKVVYIHTSGNDEFIGSAKNLPRNASLEEKTLSDLNNTEEIDKRISKDAMHRQVDGPLREQMMNPEQEKEHNASVSIMVPPLIYGVGCWQRLSIQTPMITRAMMKKGVVSLPKDLDSRWNAVWIHDLVEAYITLLYELEKHQPGTPQPAYYVFPAEPRTFLWREHFEAVASALKKAGHPSASKEPKELDAESFYNFIGGNEGMGYATAFLSIVFGKDNSYTSPDRLILLGFRHKSKGVIDSILNGNELDQVLAGK
jgi:nucleoside-diphosphate-sugar epimerase